MSLRQWRKVQEVSWPLGMSRIQEGPQITQAGGTNYISTKLKRGFVGHPAAWTRAEVRYYAHAIDWKTIH